MNAELRVGVIGCGTMGGVPHRDVGEDPRGPRGRGRRPRRGACAPAHRPAPDRLARRLARADRAQRRRRRLGRRAVRAARRDLARGARRGQARARREADRHAPRRRAPHGRHGPPRRPQAHGRARGALQPGGRQARRADRSRAGSAASSVRTPPASGRCPRGSATPASRSTWRPTTWTSCSTSCRADITSVYAEGTRFSHPTQEDMITCLLRFGDDGPFGLLDVNWLTPEKRREISVIGEGGMLTRLLHHAGRVADRDRRPADRLGGAGARARRRRGRRRCASALRKVEPLRAELEAFCPLRDRRHARAGQRQRGLPRAGRRARRPRLRARQASGHAARNADRAARPAHPARCLTQARGPA